MAADSLLELLAHVTQALEETGAVYAVTGSVASSIHGEPVTSMDVDIVADLSENQGAKLARSVSGRLYADADMLRRAAIEHSMANLIDPASGYKVDISVLQKTPYHDQVLRRRIRITHPDGKVSFWVVSPEDTILMKLAWRKESRSQKQWTNALSVAHVQKNRLDWAYLRKWAGELGVEEDLHALMREAGL